jgi:recombination protein RecA
MPPRTKKKAESKAEAALDVMAEINKIMPGAVTLGNDPDLVVTRTPTDVVPIDLGVLDGGLPRGRFIEIYGSYSTLKSYFAYKAIAAYQRAGKKVALIDTEHSWDPEWGAELGIDVVNLYVVRPNTAEDAIMAIQAFIAQQWDLFVFDSIAAAIPSQHAEVRPGEDTQPGALARVMSKGLARLTAVNKHTTGIFINQTRSKIGVSFGSPTTTSGGAAMGFYASYRMSFVRIDKISEPYKQWDGKKYIDAKKVTGHVIKATLEKSKLSAPHVDVVFTYDLTTGEVDG